MAKYESVVQILEERIEHGDYLIKEFPTERKLADEVGISHMTARKVAQILIERGLLQRKQNGRLEVTASTSDSKAQIAFVSPAFTCMVYYRWMSDIISAAEFYNVQVRPFEYIHYNDAVLPQILSSVDGVFFISSAESVSPTLLNFLQDTKCMIVSLENDLTDYGIPSIISRPLEIVDQLLEHLQSQGHQRILAFNSQPIDDIISDRLNRIVRVGERMGLDVEVLNDPVKPFGDSLAHVVQVLPGILDVDQLNATAIITATEDAAIGACRVLRDYGLQIPEDISVCSVANEGHSKYVSPSITTAQNVDAKLFVSRSIKNMIQKQWEGGLLMAPANTRLFKGESTGRAKV